MAMVLKVYGWTGIRKEAGGQTREICAAHSAAEVARVVRLGQSWITRPRQLFNLGETGNDEEVATALAKPRRVFYRPLDQLARERHWTMA